MEELSTYLNMDYFNQNPFSQVSSTFYEEAPILAPQVIEQNLPAYDESFFYLPNTAFDDSYNFDQPNLFYPNDYASAYYDPIFTSLSSDDNNNYILPTEEDYNFPSSKRQKCFQENNIVPNNNFFDGYVQNPCSMIMKSEELALPQEEAQHFFTTTMQQEFKVPEFSQGLFGNYGGDNEIVIKGNEKSNISPQSVAARERRRKITVKTQELGKLVPGGSKLNTAEMLNAAGKYVQYLQAQVEMLQLMRTLQEEEAEPSIDENLQALLVSPILQEKMYAEEKCIVPKDLVTTLTNHDNLQLSPFILKDLNHLIVMKDNQD